MRSPPTTTRRSPAGVVRPRASSQRAYSNQYCVDSSTTVVPVRAIMVCSSSASKARVSALHTTAAPATRAGNTSSIRTSKPSDATWSQRSPAASSSRSATAAANLRSESRSMSVPLGCPVDPDVNSTYATSCPAARAGGRTGWPPASAAPAPSPVAAPPAAPSGTYAAAGAWAPSPSHTAASVRRTSESRAAAGSRSSRTVNPAPAFSAASMPSTVRPGSANASPTNRPGPAPRPAREAAQASVSRSTDRWVRTRSGVTSAGASG